MADSISPPSNRQKLTDKVLFDPTITLGHIITTFALMGGMFLWGTRLEGRVDTEIEIRKLQITQIEKDRHTDAQIMGEVKAALLRIENKLDGKADKTR